MVEVRTSDVVPNQQGQKTALLDLSPYRMKHAVDVQTQGTAKALFAAQLETLIADAEPSTYEELETASTLEPVPAPMLSVRNAELESNQCRHKSMCFGKSSGAQFTDAGTKSPNLQKLPCFTR